MQHVDLELQSILGLHDWWILQNTWNVDALDDLRWMMKGVNMKISRQFSPQYRDEATQSKTYFSGGLIISQALLSTRNVSVVIITGMRRPGDRHRPGDRGPVPVYRGSRSGAVTQQGQGLLRATLTSLAFTSGNNPQTVKQMF